MSHTHCHHVAEQTLVLQEVSHTAMSISHLDLADLSAQVCMQCNYPQSHTTTYNTCLAARNSGYLFTNSCKCVPD